MEVVGQRENMNSTSTLLQPTCLENYELTTKIITFSTTGVNKIIVALYHNLNSSSHIITGITSKKMSWVGL
jgi:hypothetical protein